MSIAFERIEASEFERVMPFPPASIFHLPTPERRTEEDQVCKEDRNSCSSSSSSSIGKNSDDDDEGSGENEAESSYRGPLSMMNSLEEVLPMRRGISKFYNGKSKSYTSLSETALSSSTKDIVKPEDAYAKRQRNLAAMNHYWDNNRTFPRKKSNLGGISKRPLSSSRSSLALAVAMSSSDIISSTTSDDSSSSTYSTSPSKLPPLYPQPRTFISNNSPSSSPRQKLSVWKSYSLADLQQCVDVTRALPTFEEEEED